MNKHDETNANEEPLQDEVSFEELQAVFGGGKCVDNETKAPPKNPPPGDGGGQTGTPGT